MHAFRDIAFYVFTVTSVTWVRSRTPDCKPCNFAACPPLPDGCKNGATLDICGCCYACQEDPQKRCLLVLDSSAKKWICYWIKSLQRASYRSPEIPPSGSTIMTHSNGASYPQFEDMSRASKTRNIASKTKGSNNVAFSYDKSVYPSFEFIHDGFSFNKPSTSFENLKLTENKPSVKEVRHSAKHYEPNTPFSGINGDGQRGPIINMDNGMKETEYRAFIRNDGNFGMSPEYLGGALGQIYIDGSNPTEDRIISVDKLQEVSQFEGNNEGVYGEGDLSENNPDSVNEVYTPSDQTASKTFYDNFAKRLAHTMTRGVEMKAGVLPTEDELEDLEEIELLNRRQHKENANVDNAVRRQFPFSYPYPSWYPLRLGESQNQFRRAVSYGASPAVGNEIQGLLNMPKTLIGGGKFKVDNVPDSKIGKREVSETERGDNKTEDIPEVRQFSYHYPYFYPYPTYPGDRKAVETLVGKPVASALLGVADGVYQGISGIRPQNTVSPVSTPGETSNHFWKAVETVPGNVAYGVTSAISNGVISALGSVVNQMLKLPMSIEGDGKFKIDNAPGVLRRKRGMRNVMDDKGTLLDAVFNKTNNTDDSVFKYGLRNRNIFENEINSSDREKGRDYGSGFNSHKLESSIKSMKKTPVINYEHVVKCKEMLQSTNKLYENYYTCVGLLKERKNIFKQKSSNADPILPFNDKKVILKKERPAKEKCYYFVKREFKCNRNIHGADGFKLKKVDETFHDQTSKSRLKRYASESDQVTLVETPEGRVSRSQNSSEHEVDEEQKNGNIASSADQNDHIFGVVGKSESSVITKFLSQQPLELTTLAGENGDQTRFLGVTPESMYGQKTEHDEPGTQRVYSGDQTGLQGVSPGVQSVYEQKTDHHGPGTQIAYGGDQTRFQGVTPVVQSMYEQKADHDVAGIQRIYRGGVPNSHVQYPYYQGIQVPSAVYQPYYQQYYQHLSGYQPGSQYSVSAQGKLNSQFVMPTGNSAGSQNSVGSNPGMDSRPQSSAIGPVDAMGDGNPIYEEDKPKGIFGTLKNMLTSAAMLPVQYGGQLLTNGAGVIANIMLSGRMFAEDESDDVTSNRSLTLPTSETNLTSELLATDNVPDSEGSVSRVARNTGAKESIGEADYEEKIKRALEGAESASLLKVLATITLGLKHLCVEACKESYNSKYIREPSEESLVELLNEISALVAERSAEAFQVAVSEVESIIQKENLREPYQITLLRIISSDHVLIEILMEKINTPEQDSVYTFFRNANKIGIDGLLGNIIKSLDYIKDTFESESIRDYSYEDNIMEPVSEEENTLKVLAAVTGGLNRLSEDAMTTLFNSKYFIRPSVENSFILINDITASVITKAFDAFHTAGVDITALTHRRNARDSLHIRLLRHVYKDRNLATLSGEEQMHRDVLVRDMNANLNIRNKSSEHRILGNVQTTIKYVSNAVRMLTGFIRVLSVPTAVEASGLPGSNTLASILKGVMQISNEVSSSLSIYRFLSQPPTWGNFLVAIIDATNRGLSKAGNTFPKIFMKTKTSVYPKLVNGNNTTDSQSFRLEDSEYYNGTKDSGKIRDARNVDKVNNERHSSMMVTVQTGLKVFSSIIKSLTGFLPVKTVTYAIKFSGIPGAAIIASVAREVMQLSREIASSVLKSKFITHSPTQDKLLDVMLDAVIICVQKLVDSSVCIMHSARKAFKENANLSNTMKNADDHVKAVNSAYSNEVMIGLHRTLAQTCNGIISLTGFLPSISVPIFIKSSKLPMAKEIGNIVKEIMKMANNLASELSKTEFLKYPPSWDNAKQFLVLVSKSVTVKSVEIYVDILKLFLNSLLKFRGNPTNITEPVCNVDVPEGVAIHMIENAVDTIRETSPDSFLQFIHRSLLPTLKVIGAITSSTAMMIIPQAIRYSGFPMAGYIADSVTYSVEQLDQIFALVSESDFLSNPSSWENLSQFGINVIITGLNDTREAMKKTKDFFLSFQNSALNAVVTWWWSALRSLFPETYLTYIQGFLKHVCDGVQYLTGSLTSTATSVAIKGSGVPHADLIADSTVRVIRFLNELSVAASQSNFLAKEATWENAQISSVDIFKMLATSVLSVVEEMLDNILRRMAGKDTKIMNRDENIKADGNRTNYEIHESESTEVKEKIDSLLSRSGVHDRQVSSTLPSIVGNRLKIIGHAENKPVLVKTALLMVGKMFQLAISEITDVAHRVFCYFIGNCERDSESMLNHSKLLEEHRVKRQSVNETYNSENENKGVDSLLKRRGHLGLRSIAPRNLNVPTILEKEDSWEDAEDISRMNSTNLLLKPVKGQRLDREYKEEINVAPAFTGTTTLPQDLSKVHTFQREK